jgi:anthranilate phosphoribosyltransferase
MKQILNQLFDHKKLDKAQAKEVLLKISSNDYNAAQIAAFVTVYLMRSISVEELDGFREALLEMCVTVDFEDDVIDLCGTGGDGKNTFNISTLSSFVVAGAGYKVAKHGNYGVSSIAGSSNVLERLGYKFTNDIDTLKKQVDISNICFMHAPLFHPALKSVGPIRKDLGVKTFFNMLGPLVNPAKPKFQITGVFNLQLARLYQYIMNHTHTSYAVIHTTDGYDEVSLTADAKVITKKGEQLLSPHHFKSDYFLPIDIHGGSTIEESVHIFNKVISGEGSEAQNAVVVANSALAIQCISQNENFDDCIQEARSALYSGKALTALKSLIDQN